MSDPELDRWLRVPVPRPGHRVRLVCFAYAGGGATVFGPYARMLPETVEVCAVQLPGRQDRLAEAPLRRVGAIVDEVARALARLEPAPTALFGHSFGALLAFELARRLRAEPPVALIVAARRAPQLPTLHRAHALDDRALADAMHEHYGTPRELLENAELMSLILPSLRADLEAIETYEHEAAPPLEVPLTVLAGRRDRVSADEVRAWGEHTSASFEERWVDAAHFFVDTHRDWVRERVCAALGVET